jgi:hypothetical protein
MNSEAYTRFEHSMKIGYEEWHDGVGYDLDALDQMEPNEKRQAERIVTLALQKGGGWRAIDALARIGTSEARRTIRGVLADGDMDNRLYAAKTLAEMGEQVAVDQFVVEALQNAGDGPISRVLDLAAAHPTLRVRKVLMDQALNGSDVMRVHAAALSLFLAGKAKEPFDWDERPFFLRLGSDDRSERLEAYRELQQRVGSLEPDKPMSRP